MPKLSPKRREMLQDQIARTIKLYEGGMIYEKIATEIGKSISWVGAVIKNHKGNIENNVKVDRE